MQKLTQREPNRNVAGPRKNGQRNTRCYTTRMGGITMKNLGVFFCASLMALAGSAAFSQEDFPVLPIEMFGCNYQSGQNLGDLDSPSETFNEWADEEGITDLTSLTLSPHFFSPDLPYDVIGMDIWENGAALGEGVASIASDPSSVSEFNEVVDCPAHGLYALVGVKPPEEGLVDGGLFEFSDCTVRRNRSADEGIGAVAAIGDLMAPWNVGDAHGVLFPVAGETPDADYTFKWVTYYPSAQAFGTVFDEYASGAVQTAGSIIDPVMECDISRMYDVTVMREAEAAE